MTDTTQPPAETLAECPFCGGSAQLKGANAPEYWVACPAVGCKASTEGFGSKDRAIAAWNRRAALTRRAGGDAIPAGDQYSSGYAQGQADADQLNRWMQDKAWQDTVLMLVHYQTLAERTWLVGHEVAVAKLAEWWGRARNLSETKSVEDIAATPKPPAGGDAGAMEDIDSPAARLEMVRAALHGMLDNPSHAKAYAKAGLDLLDLTSAERAIQRGEAV